MQSGVAQNGNQASLASDPWCVTAEAGALSAILWEGKEFFASLPQLNLWRAPTDNDEIRGWIGQEAKPAGRWRAAGFDRLQLVKESLEIVNDIAKPCFVFRRCYLGSDPNKPIWHNMEISFEERGGLLFCNTFDFPIGLPSLPRVGLVFTTVPGFENLEYFGKGPWENYIDRAEAPVGNYRSTVDEHFVPYILPQAHGNRTDVRRLALDNGTEKICFHGNFEFSASHYSDTELVRCGHTNELEPIPGTIVTLDLRQRGLGTASCGPDTLEKYCIKPGRYEFRFTLCADKL